MKQKQSFEEWIQDYLKGARNKGREKGKIKQGRDRRERKEEKWGGERSRKSILLGHIRRSLTMWQNLSSSVPMNISPLHPSYQSGRWHTPTSTFISFQEKNTLHVVMSSFYVPGQFYVIQSEKTKQNTTTKHPFTHLFAQGEADKRKVAKPEHSCSPRCSGLHLVLLNHSTPRWKQQLGVWNQQPDSFILQGKGVSVELSVVGRSPLYNSM